MYFSLPGGLVLRLETFPEKLEVTCHKTNKAADVVEWTLLCASVAGASPANTSEEDVI